MTLDPLHSRFILSPLVERHSRHRQQGLDGIAVTLVHLYRDYVWTD